MTHEHDETRAFRGTIDRIQLSDLVQVICLAQRNHTIRVESSFGAGVLHARSGQIYHASLGDLQGEDACYEMFRWRRGRFETTHPEAETVTTIGKNWEFLLIEGLRQRGLNAGNETTKDGDVEADGFGGDLNGVLLQDLVQLACMSGTEHALEIRSGEEDRGTVYVRSGGVFHAAKGELQGLEAFNEILRWREGAFEEVPPEADVPVTIDRPWEYLLIEATRCEDEASKKGKGEEEDDGKQTFLQRIQKMRITEKIRAAMMGDKETRSALIREPNRMIQWAIINNPRLTDGEVATMANSRSMDEEVLRKIANTREWLKLYQVRYALVTNPKTPLAISTKLVPGLMPNDLRSISRSKSVPQVVAQAARRLVADR